ncbi:DNA-3-methyladenine glycosylase family protein [Solimonas marina]|uniref:DNA-3-methyladenine glycosylase II n=1 Tax=Solimonas marina TaxID=2714601 RepID=A0A969WDM4_9GAMM|nr:DNA-3-methyladenine glycosylase 2 family protein [Solimonas marina]NKF24063.1 DNA-3-methyladenine glycosylase 2 family protein [Solimonas marina]
MPSIREQIRLGEQHLAAVDPVMAQVIVEHGPCTLGHKRRDPFHTLCSSIISQQLSSRAADTIQARVMAGIGALQHIQPALLARATHEQLRGYGLSTAKAKWLKHLGDAAEAGQLDFKAMRKLDDESAIELLDALPGIGRWTAEMFLMFALLRLDLFAMDDVGLRRGVNMLYNQGKPVADARTLKIVKKWAPYRSIASWYLWRVADPVNEIWV